MLFQAYSPKEQCEVVMMLEVLAFPADTNDVANSLETMEHKIREFERYANIEILEFLKVGIVIRQAEEGPIPVPQDTKGPRDGTAERFEEGRQQRARQQEGFQGQVLQVAGPMKRVHSTSEEACRRTGAATWLEGDRRRSQDSRWDPLVCGSDCVPEDGGGRLPGAPNTRQRKRLQAGVRQASARSWCVQGAGQGHARSFDGGVRDERDVFFPRSDRGIRAYAYHEGSGTKLALERVNGVFQLPVQRAPYSQSTPKNRYVFSKKGCSGLRLWTTQTDRGMQCSKSHERSSVATSQCWWKFWKSRRGKPDSRRWGGRERTERTEPLQC